MRPPNPNRWKQLDKVMGVGEVDEHTTAKPEAEASPQNAPGTRPSHPEPSHDDIDGIATRAGGSSKTSHRPRTRQRGPYQCLLSSRS